MDRQSGGHKRFFPSHNTYLEVSSEDGIPGLFFYLCFLGAVYWTIRRSFRLNRPGSRPDWETGYRIATALEAAFVYFVICAGFMTCERHPHQYVVAGMAVALYRISAFRAQNQPAANLTSATGVALKPVSNPVPATRIPPSVAGAAARVGTVPTAAASRPRSLLRRPR